MQFPFKPQHQIPGLKPIAEKPSGPRSDINLPLRQADVKKLERSRLTDAPNRATRKAQAKANAQRQKQEAKKLAGMSPRQQQRYRHNKWLESLRPIVFAMGNPLEDPFRSPTGSSWFFRLGS